MFGPVITSVHNMDTFDTFFRGHRMNAVKVVTAWSPEREFVYGLCDTVVVRSACGDPSYSKANFYPDVNDLLKEMRPWYRTKKNIFIQIGNEPNIIFKDKNGDVKSKVDPFAYWWFFLRCCEAVRREMPKAKIISTPLQFNGTEERWLEILQKQIESTGTKESTWDYNGWHCYEHHTFNQTVNVPRTNDVQKALQYASLFKDKPNAVVECGINDTKNPQRLSEYRSLLQRFQMVLYFHYSDDPSSYPNYRIF